MTRRKRVLTPTEAAKVAGIAPRDMLAWLASADLPLALPSPDCSAGIYAPLLRQAVRGCPILSRLAAGQRVSVSLTPDLYRVQVHVTPRVRRKLLFTAKTVGLSLRLERMTAQPWDGWSFAGARWVAQQAANLLRQGPAKDSYGADLHAEARRLAERWHLPQPVPSMQLGLEPGHAPVATIAPAYGVPQRFRLNVPAEAMAAMRAARAAGIPPRQARAERALWLHRLRMAPDPSLRAAFAFFTLTALHTQEGL